MLSKMTASWTVSSWNCYSNPFTIFLNWQFPAVPQRDSADRSGSLLVDCEPQARQHHEAPSAVGKENRIQEIVQQVHYVPSYFAIDDEGHSRRYIGPEDRLLNQRRGQILTQLQGKLMYLRQVYFRVAQDVLMTANLVRPERTGNEDSFSFAKIVDSNCRGGPTVAPKGDCGRQKSSGYRTTVQSDIYNWLGPGRLRVESGSWGPPRA